MAILETAQSVKPRHRSRGKQIQKSTSTTARSSKSRRHSGAQACAIFETPVSSTALDLACLTHVVQVYHQTSTPTGSSGFHRHSAGWGKAGHVGIALCFVCTSAYVCPTPANVLRREGPKPHPSAPCYCLLYSYFSPPSPFSGFLLPGSQSRELPGAQGGGHV